MRIQEDVKLDFNDVLIKPKRSQLESRKDAVLVRTFAFKHSKKKWAGVPIIAANMDHTGTYAMNRALYDYQMLTAICKFTIYATLPNAIKTIGLDQNLDEIDYDLEWVCLDVANGYTERFCTFIGKFRDAFPNIIIIAGNVCTADQTQELILKGADIIKCGIGPGSVCTTRVKTGVGYPQLSTIIECSDAAHGLGGHIISDGGCTVAGDIAKAFGGGADFVMLGGMLAGHDEGGGEIVDNKVQFYGMSSRTANEKHFGGLRDYRAAEGKTVEIPYRGKIINTVQDILGGLRSACTYSGARRLKDLCKCTTFIRTTVQENKVYS